MNLQVARASAVSSCFKCSSIQRCLCNGLQKDGQRHQQLVARVQVLERGEHLFNAGESFRSIYAVRSGSVKIFAVTDSGEEQVIGFALPGDVIALDAIASQRHGYAAMALETSSVCEVPYQRLQRLCTESQPLQSSMTRVFARHVADDYALVRLLGKKSAEQRLAAFLLDLSRRYADRGFSADEFNLSMSRQDIGNYLGLALETVSRLFARLQQDGLLRVNRRHVTLLKRDALRSVAGEAMAAGPRCYH